jgi:hypothetical protein
MSRHQLDLRNATPLHAAKQSKRTRRLKVYLMPFLIGISVIGISVTVFLIWQATRRSSNIGAPVAIKTLVGKVGRLYLLPSDETPAVATVTDKTKLTTTIFKNAQNGDQVLIYQKNHVAIIYRPKINRIVSIGPVSIDTPPTSQK